MGWGGTHRSWPGGRGGRPRALIPEGGVRKGWLGRQRLNTQPRSWLGGRGGQGGGARARGGCKGFGSGGVGGRGTGPRDGANFATRVVFLLFLTRTKRRKMAFLKDALWGGGGTHRSRGGRPRALIPGEGVREGSAQGRQRPNTQPRSRLGGGARASVPGG